MRTRATDAVGVTAISLDGVPAGETHLDLVAGVLDAAVPIGGLSDGPITFTALARDGAGNEGRASRTIVVDRVAPIVTLSIPTSVAATSAGNAEGAVTVAGTLGDAGSGVASLTVSIDGKPAEPISWTDWAFSAPRTVGVGEHLITVEAKDRAGNTTVMSQSVTVDVELPKVTFTSPYDGAFVGPGVLHARVSVVDATPVAHVEGRVQGGDWTNATATEEVWDLALTPPAVDGAFLVDARATDAVGHVGETTITLVRDGVGPTFETIAFDGAVTTATGTYVVGPTTAARVVATDPAGVLGVTIAGKPGTLVGGVYEAAVSVGEGALEVAVTATDLVGNAAETTASVVGDATPPTCTWQPLANDGWTSSNLVFVSGSVVDAGVGGTTVSIDGVGAPVAAELNGGAFLASVPVSPDTDADLVATCTDALGNAATTPVIHLRADAKPPVVAVTPPAGAAVRGEPFELVFSVLDASGVASGEARLASGDWSPLVYSEQWGVTLTPPSEDGPFTVEWRVTDLAGNTASGSAVYVRDTHAPIFGDIMVVDGVESGPNAWWVRGAVAVVRVPLVGDTPTPGVEDVRVTIGGVVAPWAGGAAQGSTAPTGDLEIVATDAAGNVATRVIHVTGDDTPPSCTLESAGAPRTAALAAVVVGVSADEGVGAVTAVILVGSAAGPSFAVDGGVINAEAVLPGADGPVTLRARCQDTLGNSSESNMISVIRDATAPVITGALPPSGAAVGATEIPLSLVVTDADASLTVQARIGHAEWTSLAPVAGRWTGLVSITNVVADVVVEVQASDTAGNVAHLTLTYSVDTTPPTITVVGLDGGALAGTTYFSRSSPARLLVDVTDAMAGVGSVWSQDGSGATVAPGVALTSTSYELDIPVAAVSQTVFVWARDRVGNETQIDVVLRLDETPPSCELDPPASGGWTNHSDVTVSGTTSDDGVGIATVALETGATLGAVTPLSGGTFELSTTLTGPLTTVRARCSDRLGNVQYSEPLFFHWDTTPPQINPLAPLSGDFVGPGPFTVRFQTTDVGDVVATTVTGPNGTVSAALGPDGTWATEAEFVVVSGPFSLLFTATDRAGNVGTASLPLVRDGEPPVVTATSVDGALTSGGVSWVAGPTAVVRVSASDAGTSVTSVSVGTVQAALASGTWTATVAAPGLHDVVARDALGNASEPTSVAIGRDTTPPQTCTLAALPNGGFVATQPISLSGLTVDDGPFGTEVKVGLDGATTTTSEVVDTAWSVTINGLTANAPHELRVRCKDKFGNTTETLPQPIYVDTVGPTITVDYPKTGSVVAPGAFTQVVTVDDVGGVDGLWGIVGNASGTKIPGVRTGSTWAIPLSAPSVDGSFNVIVGTWDRAQNTAYHMVTLVRDSSVPAITAVAVTGGVKEAPTLPKYWVKNTLAEVKVTVTSPGAAVNAVTIGGLTATAMGAQQWQAVVTGLVEAAWTDVAIVATTSTGAKASTTISLRGDLTAPNCVLSQPPNDGWTNATSVSVAGSAVDTGSGGVMATATAGTFTSSLTVSAGVLSGLAQIPAQALVPLSVECVDRAGNRSTSATSVYRYDAVPPVIEFQESTTKNESDATYDMTVAPPKFMSGAKGTKFGGQSCLAQADGWSCSTFSKFVSHLAHEVSKPLGDEGVPWFSLCATDLGGSASLSFRFGRGATWFSETYRPVPFLTAVEAGTAGYGIPLATEYFAGQLLPTTPSRWPDRVQVRAVDLAGNVTLRTITFTLIPLAPPPKVEVLAPTTLAPDLGSVGTTTPVEAVFAAQAPDPFERVRGVRVAHVKLSNPHKVSMAVGLANLGSTAPRIERSWATQVELQTVGACPTTPPCPSDSCKMGTNACESASGSASPQLTPALAVSWRSSASYTSATLTPTAEDGTSFILMPGASVYASVAMDTRVTCAIQPTVSFMGKAVYVMPTAGSTCASPSLYLGQGACWSTVSASCYQFGATLARVIDTVRFRWSAAIPGGSATVDAFYPGAPNQPKVATPLSSVIDFTLNVGK